MNLDQLAEAISKVSTEKIVQDLSKFLTEWKSNDETVDELKEGIERYLANTWNEKNEDHKIIYQMWSSFREEAISGIGGMTMNERLYFFCLFDAVLELDVIYRKLHAKP